MSTVKPTGGERFEGVVLVLILLIVGGFTAFASFSHVHDWTMTNSPDNTSDWFGWANAVTTELVPTASALVIRRRHRNGQPAKFAMFLLFGFVGLSRLPRRFQTPWSRVLPRSATWCRPSPRWRSCS